MSTHNRNNTIAFYSPMKPVDHPSPSGDRLMSRLLIQALELAGYDVIIASSLRAYTKDPSRTSVAQLTFSAEKEIERLSHLWSTTGTPSLWFCYHPYYKSPDLIGPTLCRQYNIPYVTAEASYSTRRENSEWQQLQDCVLDAVNQAVVNLCFTERDKRGLRAASSDAKLAKVAPFIDPTPFYATNTERSGRHLMVVAMMRLGDKLDSYHRLAASLKLLLNQAWTLSVVGHGPEYDQVRQCFGEFPPERIHWHGLQKQADVAALLASGDLYVWPGCGEAYGLAYLEAQAAGVPVVAYDTAGVPEVVNHGVSGLLTPPLDDKAYSAAIASLLNDEKQLTAMSISAEKHVRHFHSLSQASATLHSILQRSIVR